MKCKFHGIKYNPLSNTWNALITRLDDHPDLGPVNNSVTQTSSIEMLDIKHGVLVVYEYIYWWEI